MKYTINLLTIFVLFASAQLSAQTSQKSAEEPTTEVLNVFIPNAFTPNGDGYNDVFRPTISGPDLDFYELSILDRNGDEVFSSKDPSVVWDGTTMGGSYVTSPMIYIYLLKIKSVEDRGVKIYRGHITMIR